MLNINSTTPLLHCTCFDALDVAEGYANATIYVHPQCPLNSITKSSTLTTVPFCLYITL